MIPIEQQIIDLIRAKVDYYYSEAMEAEKLHDKKGETYCFSKFDAAMIILEEVEELVDQQENNEYEAE